VKHAANFRELRNAYNILVKGLEGRDHMEDSDVDERMSKWIFGK
jgi:hypothetical protein